MTLSRLKLGPRMNQAVRAGYMVYLAGQIPDDRTADISGQTEQTLAKVDALLAELGASKSNLVSMQIWMSDMSEFAEMNAVWDSWVDAAAPPARATCGTALASPGVKIEIIAVAYLGDPS